MWIKDNCLGKVPETEFDLFHGVQVEKWCSLASRGGSRTSLALILLNFYTTSKWLIPFKMGTIELRCFFLKKKCVLCQEVWCSAVKDKLCLLDQIFLYLFTVHSTTWMMLPKENVLPCLMFATQAELQASHDFTKFSSSSRRPQAAHQALVEARLQEQECSTCWRESTMNVFINIKRWSECALPLVHDNFKCFCINCWDKVKLAQQCVLLQKINKGGNFLQK